MQYRIRHGNDLSYHHVIDLSIIPQLLYTIQHESDKSSLKRRIFLLTRQTIPRVKIIALRLIFSFCNLYYESSVRGIEVFTTSAINCYFFGEYSYASAYSDNFRSIVGNTSINKKPFFASTAYHQKCCPALSRFSFRAFLEFYSAVDDALCLYFRIRMRFQSKMGC